MDYVAVAISFHNLGLNVNQIGAKARWPILSPTLRAEEFPWF